MNNNSALFFLSLFIVPALFAQEAYVRPYKIVMVWDYIAVMNDNLQPDKGLTYNSLDVVSPTWFSIKNEEAELSSLADRGYVKWAHENGFKVWALFENSSDNWLTKNALADQAKRMKIIEQISRYVREYNLDGINIDFEAIRPETGKLFEHFIVELYRKLKPMGVVLSVDIPFPVTEIQNVYDISLIAENCDYVVMMAYDQHYDASLAIGPVASIGWVRQGIQDALHHVSPDKFILGVPFYTRIWVEDREGGGYAMSSWLDGMEAAHELFSRAASLWEREQETEQIYAEFKNGLKSYKVWLEDEHSLSLKLDAINDYGLAGMSAWRRGWEGPEIWNLIGAYFE